MNREQWEKWVKKIKIVLLVFLIATIICGPIFIFFRIKTEGRLALREAKNVNLQLQMYDIEAYAKNDSVYDSGTTSGISKKTLKKIQDFMGFDFELKITSYSVKMRKVTGFVYQRGNYQVIYEFTEDGNDWKVNYLFKILDYDGE